MPKRQLLYFSILNITIRAKGNEEVRRIRLECSTKMLNAFNVGVQRRIEIRKIIGFVVTKNTYLCKTIRNFVKYSLFVLRIPKYIKNKNNL